MASLYRSARKEEKRSLRRETVDKFNIYDTALGLIETSTKPQDIAGMDEARKICAAVKNAFRKKLFREIKRELKRYRKRQNPSKRLVIIFSGGLPGSGKRS
jgi:hypothetical protein